MSDQTITGISGGWSVPVGEAIVGASVGKQLTPGALLGERYKIIRLIGQGGMGAVYKANDRELDRFVALKVIRTDLVADPEILKRFKQELILARQITHRNVIRIFDLGQADGIKFITMEFIEGEDLQSLLKHKKNLEPAEAVGIMAQVCRALEAAHAEGVIHRDLKPQNIMLDKTGRACVMDFGIARSMIASGMTQTGGLVGTPDYMSPEQAKGLPLDARSDIFAAGIIFYELLSGQIPYHADTTMGKLWKRTSEPARPVTELDKSIPPELGDIVRKCLEIDPQLRTASASELLKQIDEWRNPNLKPRADVKPHAALPEYLKWIVAAGVAALVVASIAWRWISPPAKSAPHPGVTLLIADFDNKTGDPVLDGTLEPILGIELEGASFISSYSRAQAKKAALRVQPKASHMDGTLAELIAVREGIDAVVTGSITKDGDGYTVNVKTLDSHGNSLVRDEVVHTSNKRDVLSAAGKIAERIRKGLGDTPVDAAKQSTETYTAASLEAAHEYATAQDLQQRGKWAAAIKVYTHTIELDPEMGRAYAGIASTYANLGKQQEAEKNYQFAMSHIDRMTDREKYRTRAGYFLLIRNHAKAIEELTALVKLYPTDAPGLGNLALSYFYQRDMGKALEEQKKVIAIAPNSVLQRSNLSLYALYAGDFDTAAREAQRVLQGNPEFDVGIRTLALAQLGSGHVTEASQEYAKLQAMSPRGAAMASTGMADLALYEGRLTDAVNILQKSIATALTARDLDSAANDQATLAQAFITLNRASDAQSLAGRAIKNSKDNGVFYRAAQVYLATGQEGKALQIAASLSQRLESEPQMYAKLIAGEALLRKGKAREAINLFHEAQRLSDSWLGHFDLGRAYLDTGAFTEASSEFDICLSRRGEANSVFLDDLPSYHVLPAVYYYQGRARDGLKSPGAAESYRAFLDIKAKDSKDPLVADAAKRLAGSK